MSGVVPAGDVSKPQNPRAAWKEQSSRTRSWFEPSSSSSSSSSSRAPPPALSATNPGSISTGNLRAWNENPTQISPTSTSAPSMQLPSPTKKWHENPLGNHTFHFTSLSSQPTSSSTRSTSPKRRPTFPLPTMAPISTSSSSSATRSTSPSPTNVPPMPAFGDVFATANGIYSRSLSKLSVSKDLPRFCPNIRIYKSHEVIQRPSNCDGAASHIADIKGFLLTLLTYLDPPHLVQAFEANFSKYVTEELDIATRLQAFFQSGVLPVECNTFAVLRCIHQEIIFPVVMSLRQSVYEMFPYKDVKGSWNIYVVLVEAKGGERGVGRGIREVKVFHTKKEQSHDPNPSAHFEFEWAMALTLSLPTDEDPVLPEVVRINTNELNNSGSVYKSELQLQSVDFWVINYWTNDGFDKNTKPLLLKVLQKFFHPSTGTMCLWGKHDIFQVNVSRDFPRLAVKTTVYDTDKNIVLFSPAALSEQEPAFSVLLILIERLNPEYMDAIRKAYDTHVEKGGDKLEYSMRFANFMQSLVSDKVVPEDCLLVKVLKCITNEIIYPSAMVLREQIYGDFPYKDVRNSRKLIIRLSERKHRIKISHLKSEQTNDSSVEFEWQVSFTISKTGSNSLYPSVPKIGTYSSVKTRLQIDRYVLSEGISNSLKIQFRELVHSLVAGRAEKQGVPVPALEFLQCMLQSVENSGEGDKAIRLPRVSKMIPLTLALQYLSNALAKVPFELPPVVVPKNRTDSLDPSFAKQNEWK